MRFVLRSVSALACVAAAFAMAPAWAEPQQAWQQQGWAQQSFLYPPEVPFRAVVVVDDPSLQRRYWDPRFCDCGCGPPLSAHRHSACPRPGAWR